MSCGSMFLLADSRYRSDAQSMCRVSTDSLSISSIFFNSSMDVDNGGIRTSTLPIGRKINPFVLRAIRCHAVAELDAEREGLFLSFPDP